MLICSLGGGGGGQSSVTRHICTSTGTWVSQLEFLSSRGSFTYFRCPFEIFYKFLSLRKSQITPGEELKRIHQQTELSSFKKTDGIPPCVGLGYGRADGPTRQPSQDFTGHACWRANGTEKPMSHWGRDGAVGVSPSSLHFSMGRKSLCPLRLRRGQQEGRARRVRVCI